MIFPSKREIISHPLTLSSVIWLALTNGMSWIWCNQRPTKPLCNWAHPLSVFAMKKICPVLLTGPRRRTDRAEPCHPSQSFLKSANLHQKEMHGLRLAELSRASLDWLNFAGTRNECSLSMRICGCLLHSKLIPTHFYHILIRWESSLWIHLLLQLVWSWGSVPLRVIKESARQKRIRDHDDIQVASSVWKEYLFGNHTYNKLVVSLRKLRTRKSYLVTGRNQGNF